MTTDIPPESALATSPKPVAAGDWLSLLQHSLEQAQTDPMALALPALGGAAGTLLAALLVFAAAQAWQRAAGGFWRAMGRLGSVRGFSWLALRAYRNALAASHSVLRNIYLGREEELTLQQVFVPLCLRATATTLETQPRDTQQILSDPQQKRLVLLGAPGSGKSTSLKALAVGVSRSEWPPLQDAVPILVSLRAYGQAEDSTPLLDWLVGTLLPGYGLQHSKVLLQALMSKGRLLLLLDGLDEVAGERLETVNRRITAFLDECDAAQQCRVLLTCREQNYDDLPDRDHYARAGFAEYRVAELRDSEIRAIVQRRAGDFRLHDKSLEHYLDQVFQYPDIAQLHRSPLLLTLSMGVYLHQPGEAVPHNLAAFYEQAIDNLLRRHDFREAAHPRQNAAAPLRRAVDYGSANRYPAEAKFALLKAFALHSLLQAEAEGRDFEEFSYASITALAEQLAQRGVLDDQGDAAALVREIHIQAGLFSALQDGVWVFAHRSLHEYCAARAAMERNRDDEGYRLITGHLHHTAWRQVIFFYAAMQEDNAVRLVETLAEQAEGEPALLPLAGHCAAVLVQPQTALRLRILENLSFAVQQADEAHRPVLLKSLLALGNSRDARVRDKLDEHLRALVDTSDPSQVAREAGRMEPALALQFLAYLAGSPDGLRKRAALEGLAQLESPEKIPVLWRLLGHFLAGGDNNSSLRAMEQLLPLLAEADAVEHLNTCEPLPADAAVLNQMADVYPFLPTKTAPTHLALLLTHYAQLESPDMRLSGLVDPAWRSFLKMVLVPKSPDELREWRRLPRDVGRWLPRIATITLGRGFYHLTWVGALLWMLAFWQTGIAEKIITGKYMYTLSVLISVTALSTGPIFALCWQPWRAWLNKRGLLGDLAAYPKGLQRTLPKPDTHGVSLVKRVWRIGLNGMKRSAALNRVFLLLALAAFLNHPVWVGHGGRITSLALDPAGAGLISGSYDNTARLWDAQTGAELRRLQHGDGVIAVAFAPDGKTLLTASWDNTARLWDAQTGAELRRLPHDSTVNAVAFAPDGKTLLTGSWNSTARLWDAQTSAALRRFAHSGDVKAVAFAPDGQTLYTAGDEGIIRAWDADSGALRWQSPRPYWSEKTWNRNILYIWLLLVFLSLFLPALNWFDRGRVIYLRKPNRYLHLYQIPGVERWLPPPESVPK
ncbi:MAG: NACHT domain-containing protein [Methylococcaceae bacterium]|nr:MAG: NACHT domain-containing protein [Methylococcaceae bacterium]